MSLWRRAAVGTAVRLHRRWLRVSLAAESRLSAAFARLRGAQIGERVAFVPERLIGDVRFLRVADESAVGRATLLLLAPLTLGARSIINDGVSLLTGDHDLADPGFRLQTAPITVGPYAWICTGAIVLPGVTIGEGAVVGAAAVVRRDVAPFDIVAGNPATVVGRRRATELRYQPGAVTYLYSE